MAAAVSGDAPFSGLPRMSLRLPGAESTQAIRAGSSNISPDYFRAIGLPLLQGRTFTESEAFTIEGDGCGPVILSASLASRLFGNRDAVGQTVVGTTTQTASGCVVVGVVGDLRSRLSEDWEPVVYRPLGRGMVIMNSLLARSASGSATAIEAVRDSVSAIDPALPLRNTGSLDDVLAFQMAGQRIISWVLGVLASLGLVLAAVGLYGLVAETVVDRTREFAIRTAIGAAPRWILASVLGRAAWLAAGGIAAGALLAAGLGHALRSQLFGVAALEPWVVLGAAGVLAGVVLLASLAPALRAARVNPVDVLRAD